MRKVATFAAVLLSTAPAWASGTVAYGSREGMDVTVVSMSGLDTAHAIIHTKHTAANASAYCRGYANDSSKACVERELKVPLNNEVHGNCATGQFVDFTGHPWRFAGKNHDGNAAAHFRMIYVDDNTVADGSGASSYDIAMGIYKALCPSKAPDEREW